MCEVKFHVKLPIFVARQWVRHRTASLNERSGRYSVLDNEAYVPEALRIQDNVNKQGSVEASLPNEEALKRLMHNDQEFIFERYDDYLKAGVAKELARLNNPVSSYTEWYWKIDLKNLLHFISLRMHEHAQWEFRQYATAMYNAFIKPLFPVTCEAFEDYTFNACTFSAQEMKALRRLISGAADDYVKEVLEGVELPKSECEAFKAKLQYEF